MKPVEYNGCFVDVGCDALLEFPDASAHELTGPKFVVVFVPASALSHKELFELFPTPPGPVWATARHTLTKRIQTPRNRMKNLASTCKLQKKGPAKRSPCQVIKPLFDAAL
jgi:hypothetical protein